MPRAATFPAERSVIRPFVLPDHRGQRLDLEQFRQQRNLVLLFLHHDSPAAEALLRELGTRSAVLAEEEAVVLTVLHGDQAASALLRKRLQLPFPVLADHTGAVVASFAGSGTASYITDRFREIFATRHGVLFSADEVLEWLAHINRQCPE